MPTLIEVMNDNRELKAEIEALRARLAVSAERVNDLEESDEALHEIRAIMSSRTEDVQIEIRQMREALQELCEVKIIKDVQGDTPEYRDRKGPAWEAAFECFPEYSRQETNGCPAGDAAGVNGSIPDTPNQPSSLSQPECCCTAEHGVDPKCPVHVLAAQSQQNYECPSVGIDLGSGDRTVTAEDIKFISVTGHRVSCSNCFDRGTVPGMGSGSAPCPSCKVTEPVIHFLSHGFIEPGSPCGAKGMNDVTTKRWLEVTCPSCIRWSNERMQVAKQEDECSKMK